VRYSFELRVRRLDVVKIILGVVFIIGGLSGKLVLIGTQSGIALAAVGVVLVLWGLARLKSQGS
jgi:hypothetical protein